MSYTNLDTLLFHISVSCSLWAAHHSGRKGAWAMLVLSAYVWRTEVWVKQAACYLDVWAWEAGCTTRKRGSLPGRTAGCTGTESDEWEGSVAEGHKSISSPFSPFLFFQGILWYHVGLSDYQGNGGTPTTITDKCPSSLSYPADNTLCMHFF